MGYIDADLFFARVKTGDRFRFRQRPGEHSNTSDGLILTATGPAQRMDDTERTLYVPFTWPDGHQHRDGAIYRDTADREEYEILPAAEPKEQ